MTQKQYDKIRAALLNLISNEGTEWGAIVEGIKGCGIVIKNWMDVRGVVQELTNEGAIVRTDDIRKEVFIRVRS